MSGWIGVDLDGTLAEYDGWKGVGHIGAPVPAMVARVKQWLADGIEVRVFTARATPPGLPMSIEQAQAVKRVKEWTIDHIGVALQVTCVKDFGMVELWDDRAVTVLPNTGRAPLRELTFEGGAIKTAEGSA